MKKKIGLTALTILMGSLMWAAVGCADADSNQSDGNSPLSVQYSITFKQEGKSDVIKYVNEGETLTDIPMPVAVDGYTIVWEDKDFSNISSNIIVLAIQTANVYSISFDMNIEGIASVDDLQVTYAQEFTLPKFGTQYVGSHDCYDFLGWYKVGTNEKVESGTYTWASNLELEAKWSYSYGTDQIV